MLKNKKGFTLIELLATIVILGIIMIVAVPNVTGIIYRNRSNTYVEDAKKMVTLADYAIRGSNNKITRPADGHCIAFSLHYLDNLGGLAEARRCGTFDPVAYDESSVRQDDEARSHRRRAERDV